MTDIQRYAIPMINGRKVVGNRSFKADKYDARFSFVVTKDTIAILADLLSGEEVSLQLTFDNSDLTVMMYENAEVTDYDITSELDEVLTVEVTLTKA